LSNICTFSGSGRHDANEDFVGSKAAVQLQFLETKRPFLLANDSGSSPALVAQRNLHPVVAK
jgi:hypothetical protein